MGRWAFFKCVVTQYGCFFFPPNAAIIWSGKRMLCNATDLHIVVHMEVKGSDIRAENPNSLLLNLTLSYLLMKVLISDFSCILASAFLHWQRSISLLFAFRFCATRRVADEMVVTRAIDIWPNFVTRIKDWEGQCQSNRLNNKSYETLVGHYQNHPVPLRMEFFRYIANLLQNFLTKF